MPGLGRVSLSTGSSIFPKILGPSNFSALILESVGASSSGGATTAVGGAGVATAAGGVGSFSASTFFLADFFGLLDESMASKSILATTVVPSSSGAAILICSCTGFAGSGCGASGKAGIEAGASTGEVGSALTSLEGAAFFSSFLKDISSSSFFFFGSDCATLGIST